MNSNLFTSPLKVINIGLTSFKEALDQVETPSLQLAWRPPLVAADLYKCAQKTLASNSKQQTIATANKLAVEKLLAARPTLIGMGQASEVIPGMHQDLILHAGPPITWERMCGPMKGAVIGALIYEGRAPSFEAAEKLILDGCIKFDPCHEHQCVGPMAGVISPSMPVFIIKNESEGNLSFATMNEGLGKVLRYGANSSEVISRLKWMEQELYPLLAETLKAIGNLDLKAIMAQALHMGDEVHNRNRAATSLFFRQIAPVMAKLPGASEALSFINSNDHFFLNLSMAAAKASLDPLANVANSSLVYTMARNGTDFGIKIAGLGNRWFTGTAPIPKALYFPGYSEADANPDIGDSAITETYGVGGMAMAASPAIVQFVGGNVSDAINYTLQMYEITACENSSYQIPYLNFRGSPTAIDLLKVIDKNILPVINTGVAHKLPGVGQVGAGVLNAPSEPFVKAYLEFIESIK
ncbi:MAG: DUF1116 domain-containing protein [Oligoflexia bacterium]|nr:DUF1116 domain-containing protein [Oligoflexia bacterium]